MTRFLPLPALLILTACGSEPNHLGNPLLWPFQVVSNAAQNAAYDQTRGAVEVFVNTNHPALIRDIRAGGGATLSQVFDIANVPAARRAPHIAQMQSDIGLYETNLDALVVAIMVVSG